MAMAPWTPAPCKGSVEETLLPAGAQTRRGAALPYKITPYYRSPVLQTSTLATSHLCEVLFRLQLPGHLLWHQDPRPHPGSAEENHFAAGVPTRKGAPDHIALFGISAIYWLHFSAINIGTLTIKQKYLTIYVFFDIFNWFQQLDLIWQSACHFDNHH